VQPLDPASPHPVDQLIVRLIRGEIEASPEDVDRIVQRMATAPFNQHPTRVPLRDRGTVYGSIVLRRLADPLEVHLVKRVVVEEQWAFGTTMDEYLADLRSAILHDRASLLVYERTNDLVAATMTPTDDVVPASRRGVNSEPNMLVVYSARHGSVLSAYMFSTVERLDLPEAIRWLR
jgi:hypothetical protein